MKRFVLGLIAGILLSALALAAQQLAGDKVVTPEVIVENQKVKSTRIHLKPGEKTPLHTHSLDHIAVVVQGSTMKTVSPDGESRTVEEKTGDVVYVPANGRTHSLANIGSSTLEIVSIDLK